MFFAEIYGIAYTVCDFENEHILIVRMWHYKILVCKSMDVISSVFIQHFATGCCVNYVMYFSWMSAQYSSVRCQKHNKLCYSLEFEINACTLK